MEAAIAGRTFEGVTTPEAAAAADKRKSVAPAGCGTKGSAGPTGTSNLTAENNDEDDDDDDGEEAREGAGNRTISAGPLNRTVHCLPGERELSTAREDEEVDAPGAPGGCEPKSIEAS